MAGDNPRPLEFNEENFAQALSNEHLSCSEVRRTRHFGYLWDYLTILGCKVVVVEEKYVDHDYLEDYTAHYATCFAKYERWCKRLHFFREAISEERFLGLIAPSTVDKNPEKLGDEYLGFVVARPLPQAIIGRTVLRPWNDDGGRRAYKCVREYKSHLYGVPGSLKSLAFQEQDRVLGACATVALWSAFQKTAELFGTLAPSPAVITRAASEVVHYGRPIPSDGLNVLEICRAVRHLGLEPEVVDVTPEVPLVSLVYSYLHMGLPVVLGVEVEGIGLHAITLNGYSIRPDITLHEGLPEGGSFMPMRGRHIDRLYGHDDQVGPFSRLAVIPPASVGSNLVPGHLKGSWLDPKTNQVLSLLPKVVIVPVYHKIRLKFFDVLDWLVPLHACFGIVYSPSASAIWDVHLMFSNDLKEEIRKDESLPQSVRQSVLLAPHPRFVWRGVLRLNGLAALQLLFDATGIARSLPAYGAIWHDSGFAPQVQKLLLNSQLAGLVGQYLPDKFRELIVKSVPHLHYLNVS